MYRICDRPLTGCDRLPDKHLYANVLFSIIVQGDAIRTYQPYKILNVTAEKVPHIPESC